MPKAKGKRDITKDKAYLAMMDDDNVSEDLRHHIKKRKVPITRKEAQGKTEAEPSPENLPPGSGFQLKRHQDVKSPTKRQKAGSQDAGAAGGVNRKAEGHAIAATPAQKTPSDSRKEQEGGEGGSSQQQKIQKRLSVEMSPGLDWISGEGQHASNARLAAAGEWIAGDHENRRKSMSAAMAAKGKKASQASRAAARLSLPAGKVDAAASVAAEEGEGEEDEDEAKAEEGAEEVAEDQGKEIQPKRKDELVGLLSQLCQQKVLELKRSRDPPFLLVTGMCFVERVYLKTGIDMELAPDASKEQQEQRRRQGDVGTTFRIECLREIRAKLEARRAAMEEEERRIEAFKARVEARKEAEREGGRRGNVGGAEEDEDEEVEDVPFERLKEESDRLIEQWRMKIDSTKALVSRRQLECDERQVLLAKVAASQPASQKPLHLQL